MNADAISVKMSTVRVDRRIYVRGVRFADMN